VTVAPTEDYHHTHLIAIIDSVRDKIIVKGLLKETKLNERTEALARANADIATVPTHVRVFTISLKRSTPKSSAIHMLGRPITPSVGGEVDQSVNSRSASRVGCPTRSGIA
jgi:hypothetical protein